MNRHYQVAIDWGDYKKKKLVGWKDGAAFLIAEPLYDYVTKLPQGTNVVIEKSFGSFDLREKVRTLEAAASVGVHIWTIPPKLTERYRRLTYGEGTKSDAFDARCIWEIANCTDTHVSKARRPSKAQLDKQAQRLATPEGRALILRSLDWPEKESEEFTQYLPSTNDDIPNHVKDSFFYDSNKRKLKWCWCLPLVAAAVQVIQDEGNREDFDRKVGAYGNGHPSYLRSNHYHGIGSRVTKSHFNVKKNEELNKIGVKELKHARDSIHSRHRRVSRWFFYQVKNKAAKGPLAP